MLDLNCTIVDLETTGLSPQSDRIIEIGALVLEEGRWVSSYSTLVNPERPLPPFISELTGIQEKQVRNAPTFKEIAEEVANLFRGRLLVAHNARFDQGFLRNELKRCGLELPSRSLCTVRLSRQLFPRAKGHGLDRLIKRLGISCPHRHRAVDDARVLWEFFQNAKQRFSPDVLRQALTKLLKTTSYPPGLDPKLIKSLPEGPGVYIFYDKTGAPLYVGKSIHVKERVLSHFSIGQPRGNAMSLCRQTTDIEVLETAGDLGAQLLESHLIKKLQPVLNRRQRESRRLVVLRKSLSPEGYYRVRAQRVTHLEPWEFPQIQGVFRSLTQAKKFMQEKAGEYELCPKLLGLERGRGPCFATQLEQCRGACMGEEEALEYNLRLLAAFTSTRIRDWPFGSAISIVEKTDLPGSESAVREEVFVVDQWCLVGQLRWEDTSQEPLELQDYVFDLDSYHILRRFLQDPKNRKKIRSFRVSPEHRSGQIPLGLTHK